ncbi:MAG: FixH family protein, partial [Epsilonproteobacteria bacterium]|nr:FixH family protein [Campylobacterota bacterium]
MKSNSGKIWPYIIGLSIVGIFGACVATVIVASSSPVQGSDLYMRSYHDADANVNELINAQIEFDKKYTIEYKTEKLSMAEAVIAYRITDKLGQAIDNANLEVVVTRPDVHKYDQKLINPT